MMKDIVPDFGHHRLAGLFKTLVSPLRIQVQATIRLFVQYGESVVLLVGRVQVEAPLVTYLRVKSTESSGGDTPVITWLVLDLPFFHHHFLQPPFYNRALQAGVPMASGPTL